MADILCTTDLTPASDTALLHALAMGDRLGARVSLLHVLGKAERETGAKKRVQELIAQKIEQVGGAQARILLPEGDFMEEIAAEAQRGHQFLVMGTHGPRGLRQSLFGADILKLVRRAGIPSVVVQAGTPVDQGITRIVMPVAGHDDIGGLLDAVCRMAKAWDAEVLVYQLVRPGDRPSEALLANKERMRQRLEKEGIRHAEANEPSAAFSVGFAQATIDFARRNGASAIAIMAHASEEYRYIADAEKERILANEALIPVICA